ncbi:MAG: PhoH family protein [Saprospiraceae bacterium]|nr:PhoH family protein [Saprospiraceae bacterium]MBK8635494.1 PhoH family protein [Saprospiraceae bacterium]MBP7642657.1 PhoH family protein [Saprospiraceae bacterium]
MSKIFVLDTSVLLFDHNAILNFQDNNIVIPITVLEELDNFKIGNDTKNFEAREVIRNLDKLAEHNGLNEWISLGDHLGKLKIFNSQAENLVNDAEKIYGKGKGDHKIINAALDLKSKSKRAKVVLVTKDINLRLKAKALGLDAEDYLTGRVEDVGSVSEGFEEFNNLDAEIIARLYNEKSIKENNILNGNKIANGYYVLNNCTQSALVRYNEETDEIVRIDKNYAYGIKPKNAEQTFAVDALLNDDIKLVALQGVAGTGKTLLALAAALEQMSKYEQIILSRPIVPLSNRDIGFLPGDAEDKISPYMMPLWDNLKFIKKQYKENSRKSIAIEQLQKEGKIEVTALTFIRGRSLSNVFFIVDEAQNLTPHEIKTIITRAGEGTKIIFTGDIHQIDSPYMDEKSNGLTYIIDRLKGQPLFAHVKLQKGERSELANLANNLL